ncbi:hypothetical protein [Alloalcanivorax xenomutans]|uniref:hypothetical protein n=1 Tax=Alloalcanivorax xenomutans TaxID=1094342 RepID=UPI003BAB503E
MKIFQWKNCYADVVASKHGVSVKCFFEDVVIPAVHTLEDKIAILGRRENPGDAFAQADMKDVLRETKLAFGLSVQSIWERQLRGYLRGCMKELRPDKKMVDKIEKGSWTRLCSLFLELRGIGLDCFPSFSVLDTLHLIGNACRHGDGPAAIELSKRCPDLWHTYPLMPFSESPPEIQSPSVARMDLSLERLKAFVQAIVTFWDDVEYIYMESIERKHSSLEARLALERMKRSWLPLAAPNESR